MKPANKPRKPAAKAKPVKLLSGGNPQIAKADGAAPVQAYIAAMPGWKRDIGKRLDALIVRSVQGREVKHAVLWHRGSGLVPRLPLLDEIRQGVFFRGTSLRPVPPGESTQKKVRYLNLHEDEKLVASWIRQAAELPGWIP